MVIKKGLKEVMLENWQEHMDGVRTKVKVEFHALKKLDLL